MGMGEIKRTGRRGEAAGKKSQKGGDHKMLESTVEEGRN